MHHWVKQRWWYRLHLACLALIPFSSSLQATQKQEKTRNVHGSKFHLRYGRNYCWLQKCLMYMLRSQLCLYINTTFMLVCSISASEDDGLLLNMLLRHKSDLGVRWIATADSAPNLTIHSVLSYEKPGWQRPLVFSSRTRRSPVVLHSGCLACLVWVSSFFHLYHCFQALLLMWPWLDFLSAYVGSSSFAGTD